MHSAVKTILLLLIGMLVGAALTVPALVLFLRTDPGGYLLRTYVMTLPQWPDVNTNDISLPVSQTPATTTAQTTATTSTDIAVPKAYATAGYHTALNALAKDVKSFGASYVMLVPVLTTINANSLSHNYNGFFDLIVQAKGMVADEQNDVNNMTVDLNALSSANLDTTDAQTKTMTDSLIAAGGAYRDALVVYVASLNKLLSGSAPTEQQLIDINTQAGAVQSDAQVFDTQAQSLFAHFAAAIQAAQALPPH